MTKCFEIPISLRNHCLILGIKARYARFLLNNESILVFFQYYVWINHWCSLMTSSLLCVSFMIGGVGLGVEEEVCSAIKGDISPLFCCDEEKKIDNHATFKPCIVPDCHSKLLLLQCCSYSCFAVAHSHTVYTSLRLSGTSCCGCKKIALYSLRRRAICY